MHHLSRSVRNSLFCWRY